MLNFRKYANSITEIVIPEKVILATDNFSNRFNGLSKLTKVVVPHRVTNIANAFCNCVSLTRQPDCGDQVVDMSNAFRGCTNLNGTITIGNNVEDLDYAFYNCPNIEANVYVYSSKVNRAWEMFSGANTTAKKKVIFYDWTAQPTANTITRFLGSKCQGGSCVTQTPRIDRNTGLYYASSTNTYAIKRRCTIEGRDVTNNVALERSLNGD